VRQGYGRPRLALPSRPGGKGGEHDAQRWGPGPRRWQGNDSNKKKKKKAGGNQPLARAPTATAATVGGGCGGTRGDKCPHQPSNSDDDNMNCPVYNSMRHTAAGCREIKKLVKQFCEKMQQRQDGAPSR
jgi:hypothetical protein